ncbi:MAG: hypothetical protein DMG21_11030 [Acidobacteria bacterium]|nr:MAG: hypothetical protein DMG21_11030 [Acidobacteriota bacterium]
MTAGSAQGSVKVRDVWDYKLDALLECGSLLPLWVRPLVGATWAGSLLPARKAGASSRTPYRSDFD